MTRAELIEAVKVKLEEYSPFENISGSGLQIESNSNYAQDSIRPIATYIDKTLDGTADEVLLAVPLHRIYDTTNCIKSLPTPTIATDLTATIALPDDWLRLYAFRFTSWSKTIQQPITPQGDPIKYQCQQNPYLRGKQIYPVLAVVDRTLEIYSAESASDTVAVGQYVAHVAAAEDLQADLQPFAVQLCAAKVLEIYGRAQDAKVMRDELAQMINNRDKTL